MNAIRMVWIISRNYNTDERMVPLMERIAEKLVEVVKSNVSIKRILRMDPTKARERISKSRAVLSAWRDSYFVVRKRIEDSGTDHRWEFDKKRLFEKTDHMNEVCGDVGKIMQVIDEFETFFQSEFSAL